MSEQDESMKKIHWRAAGSTDVGKVRSENQDNFFISQDQRLLVVADGMGGETGGALASKTAVEEMKRLWESQPVGDDVDGWLTHAICSSNTKVVEQAKASKDAKSMGTTMVAAIQLDNGRMHIAHVGDSRAYVIRGGEAKRLTNDHSVVMEMFLRGQINEEQCRNSPWRHLISRCLGHQTEVQVDCMSLEIEPGDCILLATDGLTTEVEDKKIGELVGDMTDPQVVCDNLINSTLEAGARDNVTIVIAKFDGSSDLSQARSAVANSVPPQ